MSNWSTALPHGPATARTSQAVDVEPADEATLACVQALRRLFDNLLPAFRLAFAQLETSWPDRAASLGDLAVGVVSDESLVTLSQCFDILEATPRTPGAHRAVAATMVGFTDYAAALEAMNVRWPDVQAPPDPSWETDAEEDGLGAAAQYLVARDRAAAAGAADVALATALSAIDDFVKHTLEQLHSLRVGQNPATLKAEHALRAACTDVVRSNTDRYGDAVAAAEAARTKLGDVAWDAAGLAGAGSLLTGTVLDNYARLRNQLIRCQGAKGEELASAATLLVEELNGIRDLLDPAASELMNYRPPARPASRLSHQEAVAAPWRKTIAAETLKTIDDLDTGLRTLKQHLAALAATV
jgi:hypothetical protein